MSYGGQPTVDECSERKMGDETDQRYEYKEKHLEERAYSIRSESAR